MQRKDDLKTPREISVFKVDLKEPEERDSKPEQQHTATVVILIQKYQKREEEKEVDDKKDKAKPAELLESIQTELIGPFLAYRSTADDKIHFNKILDLQDPDKK